MVGIATARRPVVMLLANVTPQRVVINSVVAQRDWCVGCLAIPASPAPVTATAKVCEGTVFFFWAMVGLDHPWSLWSP